MAEAEKQTVLVFHTRGSDEYRDVEHTQVLENGALGLQFGRRTVIFAHGEWQRVSVIDE